MTTPHTQQRQTGTMTNLGSEEPRLAQLRSPSSKIPPLLLALVMVSVVLLIIVGGSLFFLPELAQSRWVWLLLPFNTRFLGAIYLTSLLGLVSLVISRRITLARLIIPMMAMFTSIVLMVSSLQLQQFNPERRLTDLWFWLYWLDCVGATYFCGYLKSYDFSSVRRLPRPWSVGLGVQAGILGAYGLSLLLSPVAAGASWLWPLDVFHSQLYSAIFLAGALGSALLSRKATAGEARSLGAIQVTFSSLVLLGLWLVDREVQRIDWGSFGTWAWVGAIALLGLSGIGLIRHSISIQGVAGEPIAKI